ncbi:alpha-L-fucosidase [Salegentibacter agarivorans]|uniref:alpha-L-fucosidase n=1 Tax=Salegentibacter agarivorans TaxID=345907 RepID=A0A1I2N5L4_9FLAO|nr:alpha-L-fucosidase [Salegentibacter agarivorans]SFF96701.1 alpha-L-fucosidase [Salegentibacter agarivorans]
MKKPILFILMLIHFVVFAQGDEDYIPAKENLEAREWFQHAKFGMFIHWGVYSVLGDGEWVMNNQNISKENYEKLPGFFNPINFDATEWVKMAKNSGVKYITVTTRHHDGFSMFNTEASSYNIVDATPFGRDVIKELAEACRANDIKLFFYYSLLDWYHKDYYPLGRTGNGIADKNTTGNWKDYIAFMKQQLTELLTNYGEIGGIWFDGHWDKKNTNWHYDEIYELIHELQPQALIGNNHHIAPIMGEDFQMFERDLPGYNTTGFGTAKENIGELPKEICETINGSWGFNLQDSKHKSQKELVRYLIKSAGFGSNLLLNVGPMPNGEIQKEHQESFLEIGDWLETYGEAIYGTRQGPLAPRENMVSTLKDNEVFLWLLGDNDTYFIEDFFPKTKTMVHWKDGSTINFQKTKFGTFIEIPEAKKNGIATLVSYKIEKD